MTTTSTTELESVLSAKKAELNGQPTVVDVGFPGDQPGEHASYIPPAADPRTGEIVPAATAAGPPPASPSPGDHTPPGVAVAPARPEDYSFVPAKVLGAIPFADGYWRMARRICRTDFVPQSFRGNPEAIVAAFMRGYEMGFGPMAALNSFNPIQGTVGLKPEAMRALIFDAGHEIILEEEYGQDGQILAITAECKRKGWDRSRSYRYSMDDARLAGLAGKDNWKKMPRAMLEARATAGAGRRYFADILAGMSYTPEEIRDFGSEQEAPPSQTQQAQSHADALAASSATAPESQSTAESTDSASATSPEVTADAAPPTPSTSTKRPRGRPRKDGLPAGSKGAQNAPAPAANTPPTASEPPSQAELVPTEAGAGSPTTSADEPATSSAGDGTVLTEMRRVLTEMIKGQPQTQQPLLRAFLQRHFPDGSAAINSEADLQKAIDIAVGWPDSADQHPLPDETLEDF